MKSNAERTSVPLAALPLTGENLLQAWSIFCETIAGHVRVGAFSNVEAALEIRRAASKWKHDLELSESHRVELLARAVEVLLGRSRE